MWVPWTILTAFTAMVLLNTISYSQACQTKLKKSGTKEPSLSSDPKELLEKGIYVDKTSYALEIMNSHKYYEGSLVFLVRPPKFGKTVFLRTLQLIFEGERNKKLFKGTFIYNAKYDWKTYEVLYLDFATITGDDLFKFQSVFATRLNLTISTERYTILEYQLKEFFRKLRENKGREVIVLVDNYDSPITEALSDTQRPNLAVTVSGTIKDLVRSIIFNDHGGGPRLVLLTGVSEFRSIIPNRFRGIRDISLKAEFAAVAGFTDDELGTYLQHFIARNDSEYGNLRRKLFDYYHGYRFSDESTQQVYNPYSVIRCIRNNGTLDNYWFISGRSKYLSYKLQNSTDGALLTASKRNLAVDSMDDERSDSVHDIDLPCLTYYGGYYTLAHHVRSEKGYNHYRHLSLRVPNKEVENAIMHHLPALRKKFYKGKNTFEDLYDDSTKNA